MIGPRHELEILEARIAPSIFFISGAGAGTTALHVYDQAGHAVGDPTAAAAVGATVAVLLHAGDKLVFDPDHNHFLSQGDYAMVAVTKGSALTFLTNGIYGVNAHAFEMTELTGLAVSANFVGAVGTDVHGSVVTALDASGQLTVSGNTIQVQDVPIDGLTVYGQIRGTLIAGHGMDNIKLGGPLTKPYFDDTFVRILSGTASTRYFGSGVFIDLGNHLLSTTYTPAIPGEAAGNITHLTLVPSDGVTIIAGDGSDEAAGGSITDVRFSSRLIGLISPFYAQAGKGGDGGENASGGPGGSLERISIFGGNGLEMEAEVHAGAGGSSTHGTGGSGGHIDRVNVYAQSFHGLYFSAGDGGSSTGADSIAAGGEGGAVTNIHAWLSVDPGTSRPPGPEDYRQDLPRSSSVNIRGGQGGSSGLSGIAGAGGGIAHLTITQGGIAPHEVTVSTGAAGARGLSADGGALSGVQIASVGKSGDVELTAAGNIDGINIYGGAQFFQLGITTAIYPRGSGGGDVRNVAIQNEGIARISVMAGVGPLTGGAGGNISQVSLVNHGVITQGEIRSGPGGGGGSLPSGESGSVTNVRIVSTGQIAVPARPFQISAGGTPDTDTETGGNIGSVSKLNINAPGGSFLIGGKSNFAMGDPLFGSVVPGTVSGAGGQGGHGGDISQITAVVQSLSIIAPAGGSAPAGRGGDGGSVSSINVYATGGFMHQVSAGYGGNGLTPGSGGSVSHLATNGNIGLFHKPFGFAFDPGPTLTTMGGLSAGRGGMASDGSFGSSGTIDSISALQIAAIVAGAPSSGVLGYENAVTSISRVHARVIGANTGIRGSFHQGQFDFNNSSAGEDGRFQPNDAHEPVDGDTAVDGLVMVKVGGILTPLAVKPLLLVQV